MTLPNEPSELDDGLLTASEVAQLELNADWVVLSACNTAAGEKLGAEALSGLARAFFYAGARALLVSHWRIDSKVATRLTTSTFDIMKSNQTIGRSEALRRAMLAHLDDRSDIWNGYPGFSGSFSLIGEGAARYRRVHHSTQCIKSIGYQRLRGPGTPRQHPVPMRTDLLVRCNSAGQDQCG